MERNFPNRNHWRVFRLIRFGALVLFTAIPAQGAAPQRSRRPVPVVASRQAPKPSVLRMRVDEGKISATIVDSPLQSVLGDLAARTGVIFQVRSQDNPLVSVRLSQVSLPEAIERIASEYNAIYFYGKEEPGPAPITLVQLFPRVDRSPQPSVLYLGSGTISKGNDTADTPEQALKILTENSNAEARGRAVEVLVDDGSDRAIKALIRAISDPAPQIRASIIEGLAALDVHAALPNVLKSLKDSNPAVRRSAATAIALLGNAGNIKDLKPLTTDRDASVAAAAETAIRKLSSSVEN